MTVFVVRERESRNNSTTRKNASNLFGTLLGVFCHKSDDSNEIITFAWHPAYIQRYVYDMGRERVGENNGDN